jgi:hypothetical protein
MCSTTLSNENPTKIKIVHLDELWNFGIHLISNWRHLLIENLESSYEMFYFLIMIAKTQCHEMQCTPWPWLLFHNCVGKNIVIWTSFAKFKQLWSYDYTNQITKLIRSMKNSRTHHNLGADRWDPQLCDSVSSLWKCSFLKSNVPWDRQIQSTIWSGGGGSFHLPSHLAVFFYLILTGDNSFAHPIIPHAWQTATTP